VNLFFKIVIILSISIIPSFAQKTIVINSGDQFSDFLTKQEAEYDSITLHFNKIKFHKKNLKKFMSWLPNWKKLSSVRSVVFQEIPRVRGKLLTWILSVLPDSQLVSIKLINVKEDFYLPNSIEFSKLKKLSIINTDLNEDFFKNFKKANLPNLRHLELIKCDLDEDYIPLLRDSQLMDQIEYLDLSNNEFENDIFSLFPMHQPGNLKKLKLNKCDIVLDKDEDYDKEFLAVNRYVADTKYVVDWDSPFFKKLEHLELQNNTKDIEEIRTYLKDEKLQKLPVFFGFLLEVEKGNLTKTKRRYKKKRKDYFKLISSYPLQSIRNNYTFENSTLLNIFLESSQSKISENIILEGDRWNYLAVKALLTSNSLPALKELSIINTPMSQDEVKKLMNKFPDININAIFRLPGEFWPGISK